MDASWSTLRNTILPVIVLAAVSFHGSAATPNEAYYSQDIDDAVAAAKRNPVDTEYVGSSWYNRSTSRSFPLPKLLNTEMDSEVVEGAMGPTAAGEQAAFEASRPVRDAALGRVNKRDALAESKKKSDDPDEDEDYQPNPTEIYVPEARSENSRVREIRANVSIKATARP
ncbi:hypothetical protein ACQUQU_12900 [Thalassolituus sp. LLYu03]|uniref:hypothetical protein n=1 Tax=Thalassolituus sp. LLYu03 TaxID=3421656 RepID=UPI003D27821A